MKKAVMYGAGSIGRGFMGELFDLSGYETVFIDTDKTLIDRLNRSGGYPLLFVSNTEEREIRVRHVRGVYGDDTAAAAEEIASADLMATSVGKGALPLIAPCIAAGIRKRWERDCRQPLNMIVCENMIHANRYLRGLIAEELRKTAPAAAAEYFEKMTGTVETCIGRNVPVMTPELYGDDPLRVLAEDYHLLPVDETAFCGPLPELACMEPEPDFDYYIREKLFMYNMAHAVAGYLGALRGIRFLWETVEEPDIRYIVNQAFTEISRGMAAEFRKPLDGLLTYCDSLLVRFHNRRLHIQVPRLVQDPLRKLSPDDRLVGAARLCEKHGVFPAYIAVGIAAGYCCGSGAPGSRGEFGPDPSAVRLQEMIREKGIGPVMADISGITEGEPLYAAVRRAYSMLQAGKPLAEIILEEAETAMQGTTFFEQELRYAYKGSAVIR